MKKKKYAKCKKQNEPTSFSKSHNNFCFMRVNKTKSRQKSINYRFHAHSYHADLQVAC